MAKEKSKAGVPNRHIHARISYLQQAATYLTLQAEHRGPQHEDRNRSSSHAAEHVENDVLDPSAREAATAANGAEGSATTTDNLDLPPSGGLPLQLTTHLRQVARKCQIRLHTNIKQAICKRCSTVLIEGKTSKKYVENLSKGGRKPHADVLVLECESCGAAKRMPVGAKTQRRKGEREAAKPMKADTDQQVADVLGDSMRSDIAT